MDSQGFSGLRCDFSLGLGSCGATQSKNGPLRDQLCQRPAFLRAFLVFKCTPRPIPSVGVGCNLAKLLPPQMWVKPTPPPPHPPTTPAWKISAQTQSKASASQPSLFAKQKLQENVFQEAPIVRQDVSPHSQLGLSTFHGVGQGKSVAHPVSCQARKAALCHSFLQQCGHLARAAKG